MATETKTATSNEVSIISKMSVKTLGCNPRLARDEQRRPLCRIYGMATGTKVQEDKVQGNIFVSLTGNFEGVNLENGEVYRSGKLYLPNGIHEVIESAVKKLADGAGESVQFALEIHSVIATNPIGYSYEAKNLVRAEIADELETLRGKLPEVKVKALPAPAGAKK